MKAYDLWEKLGKVPGDAEVVLDTTIVLGNYDKCMSLDMVKVSNDGSLVVLMTIPDKDAPQPDIQNSIII